MQFLIFIITRDKWHIHLLQPQLNYSLHYYRENPNWIMHGLYNKLTKHFTNCTLVVAMVTLPCYAQRIHVKGSVSSCDGQAHLHGSLIGWFRVETLLRQGGHFKIKNDQRNAL